MLTLRPARPSDSAALLGLIRDLASYERLLDEVDATLPDLEAALFSESPRVFADVAEWQDAPRTETAGFALWFYNFSTFRGRHGIYLEDLFVRPEFRGRGIGQALLQHLAARCLDEGLTRLEWSVLDWNTPARSFYESFGARGLAEWVPYRLTGAALQALGARANRASPTPPPP